MKVHDALDLLGRRWVLRIVWELRRDALAFSTLRDGLGISPSVLSQRLAELSAARIVDRDRAGRYRLTGRGRELARLLLELNRWAQREGEPRAPTTAILDL